jgi:hypothetical protein
VLGINVKNIYVVRKRGDPMMKLLFLLLSLQLFHSAHLLSRTLGDKIYKRAEKKGLGLDAMEKLAREYQCEPLIRAIQATRALHTTYKHPGIKKRRFLQAALYIETHLSEIQTAEKHYLTKKKTGIKHAIEYDPSTKHTFIVLNAKKAYLGSGAKKKVYKSIHYMQNPKVVARSEQSVPIENELNAHKALQGAPGIMTTHAFTTRKHKKKHYTAIYSDLYDGTLNSVFKKNNLSIREKLLLMNDILTGLESMHSRNYVHRDLHLHNYLLRIQKDQNGKKTRHAVIADFGRTVEIAHAKNMTPQGSRRLCAPEGFNKKKLEGSDYFATDIYALGCIFHRLYHNKLSKWQKDFIKSHKLSNKKKKAKVLAKLKKATQSRRRYLSRKKKKKGSLSVKQDTELLILRMLRKKPAQRGTATQWRQETQRLLERA